ncbi:MAG: hypothetical protein VR64_04745 [Desulfatitalea sp. BRH_c12]|nr:MAG: hypothetical protein VR64_04745 [Desulfatitalea sp. BRH_c12]
MSGLWTRAIACKKSLRIPVFGIGTEEVIRVFQHIDMEPSKDSTLHAKAYMRLPWPMDIFT